MSLIPGCAKGEEGEGAEDTGEEEEKIGVRDDEMEEKKGVEETCGMPIMADNDEPMTSGASEIEAALKSGPTPKKDEPPEILPRLDVPHGDTVVNEKVSAEQKEPVNDIVILGMRHATALAAGTVLCFHLVMCVVMWTSIIGGGAVAVEKATAEALKNINPEMVFHRIRYLLASRGFQLEPPRNDFSIDYTQNVKIFIVKCALSSLDEILSKEMDLVFLQRLLDDILDVLDTERATLPPQMNSLPTGDPILECLAAAPPCSSRADAELLASILEFS